MYSCQLRAARHHGHFQQYGAGSVSYTHLDVYKRQGISCPALSAADGAQRSVFPKIKRSVIRVFHGPAARCFPAVLPHRIVFPGRALFHAVFFAPQEVVCLLSTSVKMYLGGAFGQDVNDVNAYAASSFYSCLLYTSRCV